MITNRTQLNDCSGLIDPSKLTPQLSTFIHQLAIKKINHIQSLALKEDILITQHTNEKNAIYLVWNVSDNNELQFLRYFVLLTSSPIKPVLTSLSLTDAGNLVLDNNKEVPIKELRGKLLSGITKELLAIKYDGIAPIIYSIVPDYLFLPDEKNEQGNINQEDIITESSFNYSSKAEFPIPKADLKKMDIIEKIGNGAQGNVYLGKLDDKKTVFKVIWNDCYDKHVEALRELRHMEEFNHNHILRAFSYAHLNPIDLYYFNTKTIGFILNDVKKSFINSGLIDAKKSLTNNALTQNIEVNDLYQLFSKKTITILVLPFMEYGSLNKYLSSISMLTVESIFYFAIQLSDGLKAVHEKGIVHHDLCEENILIGNQGKLYISDFGIALKQGEACHHIGRSYSRAPECRPSKMEADKKPFFENTSSDIYSFGAVLETLVNHSEIYKTFTSQSSSWADNALKIAHYRGFPDDFIYLILQCKDSNPEKRPTAQKIYDRLTEIYLNLQNTLSSNTPFSINQLDFSTKPLSSFFSDGSRLSLANYKKKNFLVHIKNNQLINSLPFPQEGYSFLCLSKEYIVTFKSNFYDFLKATQIDLWHFPSKKQIMRWDLNASFSINFLFTESMITLINTHYTVKDTTPAYTVCDLKNIPELKLIEENKIIDNHTLDSVTSAIGSVTLQNPCIAISYTNHSIFYNDLTNKELNLLVTQLKNKIDNLRMLAIQDNIIIAQSLNKKNQEDVYSILDFKEITQPKLLSQFSVPSKYEMAHLQLSIQGNIIVDDNLELEPLGEFLLNDLEKELRNISFFSSESDHSSTELATISRVTAEQVPSYLFHSCFFRARKEREHPPTPFQLKL